MALVGFIALVLEALESKAPPRNLNLVNLRQAKVAQARIDYKSFLIPAIAFTIPYFLDHIAEGIERKDFQAMLIYWAIEFS